MHLEIMRDGERLTDARERESVKNVLKIGSVGGIVALDGVTVAARPGEVVLVGGGDATLGIDKTAFYPGAGRLDQLAKQVKEALGGSEVTRVTVDSSLFTGPVHEPGWDDDIPTGGFGAAITALMTDGARLDPEDTANGPARSPTPDLAAGRSFAKLLGLPAGAVNAVATPVSGDTTPTLYVLTGLLLIRARGRSF